MEFIGEILVQIFAEACCQFMVAATVDGFTGVAGYKTFQKRKEARKSGQPAPPPDAWSRAFWILLPIGVVITLLMIMTLVAKHSR